MVRWADGQENGGQMSWYRSYREQQAKHSWKVREIDGL